MGHSPAAQSGTGCQGPRTGKFQGTLSSSCPWWGFQMKRRHPNQAQSVSFYPDVLWRRLRAPRGWPRAACRSHASEKLSCAAAALGGTGKVARNKRNLLQESRTTPGTSGKPSKNPCSLASSALCCTSTLCCSGLCPI